MRLRIIYIEKPAFLYWLFFFLKHRSKCFVCFKCFIFDSKCNTRAGFFPYMRRTRIENFVLSPTCLPSSHDSSTSSLTDSQAYCLAT